MTTKVTHETGMAQHPRRTSGWLTFAGTLNLVIGVFNIIDGLVALLRADYYLVGANKIMVFDFTTWGWIWLILGAVQVAVGAGIMAGKIWARALGVVFAFLAAIGHVAFLQAFPLWSVLTVGLCILLIYALTVPPAWAHG
jgi:hypothetical protein